MLTPVNLYAYYASRVERHLRAMSNHSINRTVDQAISWMT